MRCFNNLLGFFAYSNEYTFFFSSYWWRSIWFFRKVLTLVGTNESSSFSFDISSNDALIFSEAIVAGTSSEIVKVTMCRDKKYRHESRSCFPWKYYSIVWLHWGLKQDWHFTSNSQFLSFQSKAEKITEKLSIKNIA